MCKISMQHIVIDHPMVLVVELLLLENLEWNVLLK